MSNPSWAETLAVRLQPPALTPSSLPTASCSWCRPPVPCSHRDGTCPTAFPVSSGAFLLPSLSSPHTKKAAMGMGAGWRVSLSVPFPCSSLALASLEPELRDSIVAKHGDKVPYVYFNKGL